MAARRVFAAVHFRFHPTLLAFLIDLRCAIWSIAASIVAAGRLLGGGMKRIREWICRRLCPSLFFNSDASLAIDRLTVESEDLRERLARYGIGL